MTDHPTDTRSLQERLRETAAYFADKYMSHNAKNMHQAADRLDALEKALKSVEFGINGRCQICTGWMVGPYGETDRVHTKDCPIAAALLPIKQVTK